MKIGIIHLHLHLPGCNNLKAKRSRIKPLISRLHREFNVSVIELDKQDQWQESVISCAIISHDSGIISSVFEKIVTFSQNFYTDIVLENHQTEIF